MMSDLVLVEWARQYAIRSQAEGREMFPGDESAQVEHTRKSPGRALRIYREENGKDAPEDLWTLVDMWCVQSPEVLAAPYQPTAPTNAGPTPVTIENMLDFAGLQVRRSGGYSSGRCSWHMDTATQCPAPVPGSEFFCPEHMAKIQASDTPDARERWRRHQEEAAMYRLRATEAPKP
jgi:hypothetical protein